VHHHIQLWCWNGILVTFCLGWPRTLILPVHDGFKTPTEPLCPALVFTFFFFFWDSGFLCDPVCPRTWDPSASASEWWDYRCVPACPTWSLLILNLYISPSSTRSRILACFIIII
jgi:hypothetical protein